VRRASLSAIWSLCRSPLKILETDAAVPKAAAVIECQVCQHFAEEVWKVGLDLVPLAAGRMHECE